MQIHYLREEDYPYIKHKIRLSLLNAKIIIYGEKKIIWNYVIIIKSI